jgi:hypothetical protein
VAAMVRLADFQRAIVGDLRDRLACSMAVHTGKKTVAAARAYRATPAGSVLVMSPSKPEAVLFGKRMEEMYPDAKAVETYNGCRIDTPYNRILVRTYDILRTSYVELLASWGVRSFHEVILLEPSTQVFRNANLPTLRNNFDPELDARRIFEFISRVTDVDNRLTTNLTIIGTPIPFDPIFQHCYMAPRRWGLHRVRLLQAWWAAPKYAEIKMALMKLEDPNRDNIMEAHLEARWRDNL